MHIDQFDRGTGPGNRQAVFFHPFDVKLNGFVDQSRHFRPGCTNRHAARKVWNKLAVGTPTLSIFDARRIDG